MTTPERLQQVVDRKTASDKSYAMLLEVAEEWLSLLLEVAEGWLSLWLHIRKTYPDIELPMTLHDDGTDACGPSDRTEGSEMPSRAYSSPSDRTEG